LGIVRRITKIGNEEIIVTSGWPPDSEIELWPVSEIEISVAGGLCEADRGSHPPDCDRFGFVEGNRLGRPPPDEADRIWVAVGLLASLIGTEVMIGVGDLLAGRDGEQPPE
jgi:hypothetical protein